MLLLRREVSLMKGKDYADLYKDKCLECIWELFWLTRVAIVGFLPRSMSSLSLGSGYVSRIRHGFPLSWQVLSLFRELLDKMIFFILADNAPSKN